MMKDNPDLLRWADGNALTQKGMKALPCETAKRLNFADSIARPVSQPPPFVSDQSRNCANIL
jgi:hypothetical protein